MLIFEFVICCKPKDEVGAIGVLPNRKFKLLFLAIFIFPLIFNNRFLILFNPPEVLILLFFFIPLFKSSLLLSNCFTVFISTFFKSFIFLGCSLVLLIFNAFNPSSFFTSKSSQFLFLS